MEENRFEKQVRKKMEELRLIPSEAVWAKVDKEINRKTRRTRPVFWFFLLTGLFLAAPGIFFVRENLRTKQTVLINPVISKPLDISPDPTPAPLAEQSMRKEDKPVVPGKSYNLQESIISGFREKKPAPDKKNEFSQPLADRSHFHRTEGIGKTADGRELLGESPDRSFPSGIVQSAVSGKKPDFSGKEDREPANTSLENIPAAPVAFLQKDQDAIIATKAKSAAIDSLNVSKTALHAIQHKGRQNKMPPGKNPGIQLGYTLDAGISTMDKSLFHSVSPNPAGNYPASYLLTAASWTANNVSSNIYPGFSFAGGILISRKTSKRLSFTAGLGYRYFSTRIYTGQQLDSPVYIFSAPRSPGLGLSSPSSVSLPQATTNIRVQNAYTNSGTSIYTNRYHFLTLPVNAEWQLNKGRYIPLVWETGLSLSYLFSSNALHFDPVAGIYYEDNKLLNRLQLLASTAILAGFPISKNELRLGPQIQYGITGMVDKRTEGPEHLFYGGIKVLFIPHKK